MVFIKLCVYSLPALYSFSLSLLTTTVPGHLTCLTPLSPRSSVLFHLCPSFLPFLISSFHMSQLSSTKLSIQANLHSHRPHPSITLFVPNNHPMFTPSPDYYGRRGWGWVRGDMKQRTMVVGGHYNPDAGSPYTITPHPLPLLDSFTTQAWRHSPSHVLVPVPFPPPLIPLLYIFMPNCVFSLIESPLPAVRLHIHANLCVLPKCLLYYLPATAFSPLYTSTET